MRAHRLTLCDAYTHPVPQGHERAKQVFALSKPNLEQSIITKYVPMHVQMRREKKKKKKKGQKISFLRAWQNARQMTVKRVTGFRTNGLCVSGWRGGEGVERRRRRRMRGTGNANSSRGKLLQ